VILFYCKAEDIGKTLQILVLLWWCMYMLAILLCVY